MADVSRLEADGCAFHLSGDLPAARTAFLSVLESDSYNATALHHLGVIAFKSGQDLEAISYLENAVTVDPNRGDVLADMGVIQRHIGNLDEAESNLKRACLLNPNQAEHFYNLGLVLSDQNKLEDAESAYREAAQLDEGHVGARNNLANILQRLNRYVEALQEYENALRIDPGYAPALKNKADLLEQSGQVEEAGRIYARTISVRPDGGSLIRDALLLPVIPESQGQIEDYRARMDRKLNQLKGEKFKIEDPIHEVGGTNFLLAYHGLDDRDLQTKIARLYREVAPSLTFETVHDHDLRSAMESEILRIGFVSSFFFEHTVGRLMEALIMGLSEYRVEIIIYSGSTRNDPVTDRLKRIVAKFIQLPRRLSLAQEIIAGDKLDIIYFCDIGLEPLTYFLSFSRLSPIQCVGWGHPVTTGVSTIDYFVSSRLMEPADADASYSEILVQLDGIPSPIRNPMVKISGSKVIKGRILCPQSLFKFHPDFDSMIGKILRSCPNAELLILQASRPEWADRLGERLRKTIPDVVDRIRYMPRMTRDKFLKSLATANLILDTPHYSGGMTTQEALSGGTPVITLPGDYFRGRVSAGFYKKMGVMDCVAASPEAYADTAIRILGDQKYARQLRARILEAVECIFDIHSGVQENLNFFEKIKFGPVNN